MSEIQRIGIVGDGQLGRMLVEDGLRYDSSLEFSVLGMAGSDSPAAQVGARQIEGSLTDAKAIRTLVEQSDVTTWEIEHINAQALIELEAEGHNIQPSPKSLFIIQDKLRQKSNLQKKGVAVAPFEPLDNADDLEDVKHAFDESLIIKTRRGGYDGRGNLVFSPEMTWTDVREVLGTPNEPGHLYAEQLQDFKRELAVIGARDMSGRIALYPVVETQQRNNICNIAIAPARISEEVAMAARQLGHDTLRVFEGAGIFAVEMFENEDDKVVLNEVAPRVHNSGHWTDLGSETSQFEQHIRAITGERLGSTSMRAATAVMVNILGTPGGNFEDYMRETHPISNGHIRWYGKAPRVGTERKIGHITVLSDEETAAQTLATAQAIHDHYVDGAL